MSEGPRPNPEPQQAGPAASYRYRAACTCSRCCQRGLLGPVVLITIGAVFLLGQLIPGLGRFDLWPVILIVIGVMKLVETSASTEGHRG